MKSKGLRKGVALRTNKLFILLPLSLMAVNAVAAENKVEGETQCTIITSVKDKRSKETKCSYKGVTELNMSYIINEFEYELETGERYLVVDNSGFSFNKEGAKEILKETTTVNELPAETKRFQFKTFATITDSAMQKRFEAEDFDFSDLLHCFKLTQHDEAFCVPYEFMTSIS